MKIAKYIFKLVILAIAVNLLASCTGADGSYISPLDWLLDDGGTDRASDGASLIGQIIGGPIGYGVAGGGALATSIYKWFKHDKSATGLIKTVQHAREQLPAEHRETFDNASRDFMDSAVKGDLRGYVRKKKEKLRDAGKIVVARLSKKHELLKTVKEVLKDK